MIIRNFRPFVKICDVSIRRFIDEKYSYCASALVFATLLSIVPLLLIIVFLIAVFPFFSNIVLFGESYILLNFVPDSAVWIEYYFKGFVQQSAHLPTLNVLFLFLTAVLLVHTIEETLNDIWKVPQRRRTKKILALFVHCLIILAIPFVIGMSITLSSYLYIVTWMMGLSDQSLLTHPLTFTLPIIINTAVFTLLYIVVPNTKVPWLDGLLGGVTAALLCELAKIVFAYYVKQFPSYALIYGAFAIIPIFLLWLYIFWCILLFGALIAHTRARYFNILRHSVRQAKRGGR